MNAVHSPLPWTTNGAYVLDANGIAVARCELENYGTKWREQHANAAFIAMTANSHAAFLDLLEFARYMVALETGETDGEMPTDWLPLARVAIAKAEAL